MPADDRYSSIAFLIDRTLRQRGSQLIVRLQQDVEWLPEQLGVPVTQDMIHRAGNKIAAVKLLQERAKDRAPEPRSYREAAEIIAYCMTGGDAFAAANDARLAADIERRIEAALDSGTNVDAMLVLLTLRAKVIQPSVVNDFGLESVD